MFVEPVSLIDLPQPDAKGRLALETAIGKRRSIREFENKAVPIAQLGQLITTGGGEIEAGIYHYRPSSHALETVTKGDARAAFATAALKQEWLRHAGVIMVIAAVHGLTMKKYGERGGRYVTIEAGHCAQNICLQAVALGLGATEVGAFDDGAVARLLRLPNEQRPVTSIAIGRPDSTSVR